MLNHLLQLPASKPGLRICSLLLLVLFSVGCTKLGPDFIKPDTHLQQQQEWSDVKNPHFKPEKPSTDGRWWKTFNDPVLDRLIAMAYKQNLDIKTAGLRILESRAQMGIAVGSLYPYQQASANASIIGGSRNDANTAAGDLDFTNYNVGLTSAWEIDFWGRIARGIESADAALLASVASYDQVLVSIMAQVASTYITIRTFEERIASAKTNIKIQKRGLNISQVRYKNGATTLLDVNQALTLLGSTQAIIPGYDAGRRQAINALATLLGITSVEADNLIYENNAKPGTIPVVPTEVAVGIPADLLRRRPDVRLAEMQAWSQSSLIGVAEADLYPSISLIGTIGLSTGERTDTSRNGRVSFSDLGDSQSLFYQVGPALSWNVLNFGRIKNNIRVQDARLEQLLSNYQKTVLSAGQEVEDAMVGFLQTQLQAGYLKNAVKAARSSVDISIVQYRDGATDYTTVLDTQRSLLAQQDQLTDTRGSIAQNLVAMYRALGGGWQIREGQEFVSDKTKKIMRERTNWGGLLDKQAVENIPAPNEASESMRKPDW